LSECRHGFCWNCDEKPHRPVSCDVAKAWLEENTQQASLDKSLEKAVREMEELKRSWLWNMAATLGIEVMELGFLTEAYEEIAECWRRIRWVEAYGHYCLDPEAEGDRNNKHELFDRLLQEAMDSLERLVVCADHERSMLCATEVEAITETYSASKEKVEDLTRETRQHFEKLMKAAETDFQY
jgi:ariadne-1